MSDDFDRNVEALLRRHSDRLEAPPELWDSVRRRARRRRQGKALLAVCAGVVVIAGAVPAVIAVRTHSSNQPVNIAQSSHRPPPVTPSPKAAILTSPSDLRHLAPNTISFVSQTEGWVSGDTHVAGGTVSGGFGHTVDGGATWTAERATPAPQGLVRFATSLIGLSFGAQYQITRDGGKTWATLPTPGNIVDLETWNGRIWALVQSCVQCRAPRLFTATLTSPTLQRVQAVAPISPYDSAVTLNGGTIVVTGGEDLWVSHDGQTWRQGINPCGPGPQSFSAWSASDLAAECTPVRGSGSLYESNDGGLRWANIANLPDVTASTATLSAGTWDHLIITTGDGAPYVTFDYGQHWHRAATGTAPVTFAAYISTTHIVGLRAGKHPAFVSSQDAGRHWTVTPFAG